MTDGSWHEADLPESAEFVRDQLDRRVRPVDGADQVRGEVGQRGQGAVMAHAPGAAEIALDRCAIAADHRRRP